MRVNGVQVASVLVAAAFLLATQVSFAAAPATITLTLRDHHFAPASVDVPADQRVHIILVNQDGATEEFDSHDLRVEQLVTPHGRASFDIGPLRPGRYAFMGEFHPETAQGEVIVMARAG